MKKNIIVLAVLLVTHGCLNTHQRLGVLGEESNIAADSGTIWFESFVEAIDHAENFKEVQKVLDQGKAQDYLACGVELEDDEYTPIHYAAEQGNLKVVQELVEKRNVPVDIRTGIHQRTPLHLAALAGQLPVVKVLSDKDGNAKNNVDSQGDTALFYAASGIRGERNTEVVKWLLTAWQKSPGEIKDKDGFSLLDCAINASNSTLVQFLVDQDDFNRASLNLCLGIAKVLHRGDIVHILEQKR